MSKTTEDIPVRDRLLREGKRLFAQQGFTRTSIAELTAAAGVTKPMLYYYFKDKDGLLEAMIDEAYARLDAGLAAITARKLAPTEILSEVAELTCELARRDPDLARICIALEYGPRGELPRANLERMGLRTFQELFNATITAVQGGVLGGEPYEIATLIYGGVQFHIMAQLARPELVLLPPGKGRVVAGLVLRGARLPSSP